MDKLIELTWKIYLLSVMALLCAGIGAFIALACIAIVNILQGGIC